MRWTRYAGWFNLVLGIGFLIGGVAAGQAWFGLIMLAALSGSGVFMIWLAHGWDEPMDSAQDLYKYGRPANAEVLEVEESTLDGKGGRTAKVTLHVHPVNESDYKTTRTLALPGGREPTVGETVTVKFDPQSRKNVVLEEENYEVKDQTTAMLESPFFQGTRQA
jgi:hypothetical protein